MQQATPESDEHLDSLAERLDECGAAAEHAKDMTLAVEMYAAAHAVRAADS
jgi:hypothetical protein